MLQAVEAKENEAAKARVQIQTTRKHAAKLMKDADRGAAEHGKTEKDLDSKTKLWKVAATFLHIFKHFLSLIRRMLVHLSLSQACWLNKWAFGQLCLQQNSNLVARRPAEATLSLKWCRMSAQGAPLAHRYALDLQ